MGTELPLHKQIEAYLNYVERLIHNNTDTTGTCPSCHNQLRTNRHHETGCPHWGASLEDIYE